MRNDPGAQADKVDVERHPQAPRHKAGQVGHSQALIRANGERGDPDDGHYAEERPVRKGKRFLTHGYLSVGWWLMADSRWSAD